MSRLTRTNLIVGGIVVAILMQAGVASAQFAPRRSVGGNRGGYDGGYNNYDSGYYPNINQTNAAYQQANTQERAYQAQVAQSRTSAWQNINQSMAQQANMRTQSMQAQRQSSQDWWYQQQSRKLAESQSRGSYQPMNLPSAIPLNPYDSAAQAPKKSEPEIMIWPTLLKDPMFDESRAKVEAPFRRAKTDKKPLTADDYRGILQAIDAMKTKLKGLSSQVVESEYAAVEGYLDELATDAQKRIDARVSPNPATEKNEPSESKS